MARTDRRMKRAVALVLLVASMALGVAAIPTTPAGATFGCTGFPPQGSRNLPGGVCLHPPNKLDWHEEYRRGDSRTFYPRHNWIKFVDINSTTCGIRWYRADYYQWTRIWFSPAGDEVTVPYRYRDELDRGTWAC